MIKITNNNNRNNNNNNITLKIEDPKGLVQNEWTSTIFKHKTQQTFRTLIQEKCMGQVKSETNNGGEFKNETLSATGQKNTYVIFIYLLVYLFIHYLQQSISLK